MNSVQLKPAVLSACVRGCSSCEYQSSKARIVGISRATPASGFSPNSSQAGPCRRVIWFVHLVPVAHRADCKAAKVSRAEKGTRVSGSLSLTRAVAMNLHHVRIGFIRKEL